MFTFTIIIVTHAEIKVTLS